MHHQVGAQAQQQSLILVTQRGPLFLHHNMRAVPQAEPQRMDGLGQLAQVGIRLKSKDGGPRVRGACGVHHPDQCVHPFPNTRHLLGHTVQVRVHVEEMLFGILSFGRCFHTAVAGQLFWRHALGGGFIDAGLERDQVVILCRYGAVRRLPVIEGQLKTIAIAAKPDNPGQIVH